jgi:pyrroline-5-carboxylate reductase
MKIAFLGGGNMASALIGGLIAKGHDASRISVIEMSPAARERLGARYPVRITTAPDGHEGRRHPRAGREAAGHEARLASISVQQQLVISIAAADMKRCRAGSADAISWCCMPNAGADQPASPAVRAAEVSAQEKQPKPSRPPWVRAYGCRGAASRPVTAVSASGPAYVFWFIEQLAASAEKLGLSKETSMKLALHTVLGAARLAASSSETPATLRKNVTSKGGTTEAALKVFDEEKLAERFMRAVEAASRRATELGTEQGKD